MTKLVGTVKHKTFAEGTKSESVRPYICLENGSEILLFKKNDNPFENVGFSSLDNETVVVEGEFFDGTFVVETIHAEEK